MSLLTKYLSHLLPLQPIEISSYLDKQVMLDHVAEA